MQNNVFCICFLFGGGGEAINITNLQLDGEMNVKESIFEKWNLVKKSVKTKSENLNQSLSWLFGCLSFMTYQPL